MKFSSKAKTLEKLYENLTTANVADVVYFTVGEWLNEKKKCLIKIKKGLKCSEFIVRSSCSVEDNYGASYAGHFLSIANVSSKELSSAIDRVIKSYGKYSDVDEVLVQPMLKNVVRSGVAFSHDPNTNSPYRIINWSEDSDTSAITGGNDGKTWKQAAKSKKAVPSKIGQIISLIEELLEIFSQTPIDCEFAVTSNGGNEIVWLLQARPLNLKTKPETEEEQYSRIKIIENKIRASSGKHPFLVGKKSIYGVMPDWNPAEIIGIRPKPLALSLYRDMVTDAIWAYQRHNYGYRNLRSFALMPHFFGLPYIDVRLSLNSFIPANLDENLAARLVDYYVDRLEQFPEFHDKIEFEVVFSCYSFDLDQRLQKLLDVGFSQKEIKEISQSLLKLTNRIIHPSSGLWKNDVEKLTQLEARRRKLYSNSNDTLERVYWLIEDAKRYGTLPFAGLARAGFIAITVLKSLVSRNILSIADYDKFLLSISSVNKRMAQDRHSLDRSTFLNQYGHLRPGTYDILSPRYDEAPDMYFDWSKKPSKIDEAKPFSLTLKQMSAMAELLRNHELSIDPIELFDFLAVSIEMREWGKFQFSKNLSDAIALIGQFGDSIGLSREEMAFCDINSIKELHLSARDPRETILKSIEIGKDMYRQSLKLALPPIIFGPMDIWGFEQFKISPNFITQKKILGPTVFSDNGQNLDRNQLDGSIVFIPSADPGYDWLFSFPIGGLVTAWGGSNSHMAIRAGELGLPAVIGSGEELYSKWRKGRLVEIDCANQTVKVIS